MKYFVPILIAASLSTLCGCGKPASASALTTSGQDALNSGREAEALKKFDAALAQLDPTSPEYAEPKFGRIRALTATDAELAKVEFLEYADVNADITQDEYVDIAGLMTSNKQFLPAIALLHAGVQRYGESDKLLEVIELIEKAAKNDGNDEALTELAGLGYLGK